MPVNIEPVTGVPRGRLISLRSVSNAASAGFFALRDALVRMLRDVLRPICTIVRGAGFVLKNAPPGSSPWLRRGSNAVEDRNGGIGSYW